MPSLDDYMELKQKLMESESRIDDLLRSNQQFTDHLRTLESRVDLLMHENVELKMQLNDTVKVTTALPHQAQPLDHEFTVTETLKLPQVENSGSKEETGSQFTGSRKPEEASASARLRIPLSTKSNSSSSDAQPNGYHRAQGLNPTAVIDTTELLTAHIRRLYEAAQTGRLEMFTKLASEIEAAVDSLWTVGGGYRRSVDVCLSTMLDAAQRLAYTCERIPGVSVGASDEHSVQVAHIAYEVARGAKELIALVQQ